MHKAAAIALIVMGAVCAVPTGAYASDEVIAPRHNVDKNFHFDFSFINQSAGSSIETKDNATSAYVYMTSITIPSAELYVDGGPYGASVSSLVNCMGGTTAKVWSGMRLEQYCIRNLVYERFGQSGKANARLTGWGKGNSGSIRGVWSPDSLRPYTPLNGYCNPDIW